MVVLSSKRGEVTFVCNRPSKAKSVYLAGSFNEWDPSQKRMVKTKDGSFRARIKLPPGKHEYKFVVDGQWIEDEEADTVVNELGTANSVIEITEK
jgi:1,4-alpha-glucan branching enzyme